MTVARNIHDLVRAGRSRPTVLLALSLGLLLYAYWPTLGGIANRWSSDPHYSHGYLVPAFALALVWLRRDREKRYAARGSWWGAAVLTLALGLHLAGAYFYHDWLSELSLLPALAGLALCLGGWPALAWTWPAIAFLVFMLPLPYRLETALSFPLRRVAALGSSYLLQTLGLSAIADGNVIKLENARPLDVAEACSGLGMLMTFFALATAVAILSKRPWPDRVLLVVSAVPIAVLANVVRITATGVVAETLGQKWADLVFHDLAGYLMMLLALGLLGLELVVLSWVLVDAKRPEESPAVVDFGGPMLGPLGR